VACDLRKAVKVVIEAGDGLKEAPMTTTSYTEARASLALLLDRAADDRETIVITRRGRPDVALIAADELAGLTETVHLLRSRKNAQRLLESLEEALEGETEPRPVEALKKELGLDAHAVSAAGGAGAA
jgi:antitoxin YefM